MAILPPSFSFSGDRQKAVSLKAQALQFYNSVTPQASREGLNFVSRVKVLPDGSSILFTARKESNYGHWSGRISISSPPLAAVSTRKQSRLLIHGFILGSTGTRVTNSEFLVHSPSFTGRFPNAIYLTDYNTLASSPDYPDTTHRLTFGRYNENTTEDFIFFGGPSNPEAFRDPFTSGNMCDGVGKFYYQGLLYEPASTDLIMDARVIGTTIHVLRNRWTSASNRWTLTYSTYTVGDINSKVDWTNFLLDMSDNHTLRLRGQSLEVPSVQAATALITLISEDTTSPTPTGASTKAATTLYSHYADARFNLDCTTISFLANARQEYNMTAGGTCYFHTNLDFVYRISPLTLMDVPLEVTDAYSENTESDPITYHLYLNQYARIKKTTSFSNITSDNYLNKTREWFTDTPFISETVIGPSPVTFDLVADWEAHLDLYGPPGGYPRSSWTGPAITTFTDINSSSGTATRPYFDSGTGTSHTHQSNVCTRRQKEYGHSTGQIDVSLLGEGTFYCGYSFDLDTTSLTYGVRRFVEIGYKTETPSETIVHSFVSTIAWRVTWESHYILETISVSSAEPNVQQAYIDYYNAFPPSQSSRIPITTGTLSKGIWIGSKLINRIGSMLSVQAGVSENYYNSEAWELESGTLYLRGQTYHRTVSQTPTFDFTAPAYPYRHIWDMNYNSATEIRIGHTDYDRETGCFYILGLNVNQYRVNTTPDITGLGLSYYNEVHLADEKAVATLSKVVVVNGVEIPYQSVHESYGTWSQSNQPSLDEYIDILPATLLGLNLISWTGQTNNNTGATKTSYIDAYQNPLSVQGGMYITNSGLEYVVSIPYQENGVSATTFPTTLSQIPRGDISVINPVGTIMGQSIIFPDGSTPNTPVADYKRITQIGVTGIE